nr:hypothetical protein [Variovorax boronicumulans]
MQERCLPAVFVGLNWRTPRASVTTGGPAEVQAEITRALQAAVAGRAADGVALEC